MTTTVTVVLSPWLPSLILVPVLLSIVYLIQRRLTLMLNPYLDSLWLFVRLSFLFGAVMTYLVVADWNGRD